MFGRKKKTIAPPFDPAGMTPAIRASICTGERTAGFRDAGGKFHEIQLLRSDADFQEFLRTYSLRAEDVQTIY